MYNLCLISFRFCFKCIIPSVATNLWYTTLKLLLNGYDGSNNMHGIGENDISNFKNIKLIDHMYVDFYLQSKYYVIFLLIS